MVREITSEQFTDRLSPIFESISREINRPFKPEVFFPQWRQWMKLGIARTWEDDGVVLGALFANDVFCGDPRVFVHFWFALPEVRRTGRAAGVLDALEAEVKRTGYKRISISLHSVASPKYLLKTYINRGYNLSESVFIKEYE